MVDTRGSPATLLVKHIPPWFPFAQWKRDGLEWAKQYNFARDYMFGAVKNQLVRSNCNVMERNDTITEHNFRSLILEEKVCQHPSYEVCYKRCTRNNT